MTSPEPDFDALVDALRSDLPNDADERRVRARLFGAGVGVTAGLVAPNAVAGIASASSAPIALLHKLGALSWLTKVGIASVAAVAVVPVAIHWSNPETRAASVREAPPAPRVAARQVSRESRGKPTAAAELSVLPTPAAAAAPKEEGARALPGTVQAPEPPALPPSEAQRHASELGPVAAFPVEESLGPNTASTLGEETALVERALYALRLGDREGARRALVEHARRFPNGLLVRERERALTRASEATGQEESASP